MKVECQVNECYQHHDMENEAINAKARKLAEQIEYALGFRKTFCSCNIEKYVISLDAERVQKTNCNVIIGCPHFYEQLIKATSSIRVDFS